MIAQAPGVPPGGFPGGYAGGYAGVYVPPERSEVGRLVQRICGLEQKIDELSRRIDEKG